jgi:hypothetical protein
VHGYTNHHFWHGYFDGDGCLYINKSVTLQFWSAIDQDWSSFCEYLVESNYNFRIWKYERKKADGKTHKSSCLGIKNTLKIQEFLSKFYDGGLIGLTRKYSKFLLLKDYIDNRKNKYPKTGSRYYQ